MLFTCYEQTLASSHIHLKQYYIVHIKKKSLSAKRNLLGVKLCRTLEQNLIRDFFPVLFKVF